MKRFAKIVNDFKVLHVFVKHSILHVWQSPEYASEYIIIILSE